ncbi:MAG: 50S ribosomal protein L29 [Saprospiraceae bacterium]
MAKQKVELADTSTEQLQAEVERLEQEYRQQKFDHAVKGLANPMELRAMRRNIARYYTEMRLREVAQMTPDQLQMRTKLRARRSRK